MMPTRAFPSMSKEGGKPNQFAFYHVVDVDPFWLVITFAETKMLFESLQLLLGVLSVPPAFA
jgi:hypothetical protein